MILENKTAVEYGEKCNDSTNQTVHHSRASEAEGRRSDGLGSDDGSAVWFWTSHLTFLAFSVFTCTMVMVSLNIVISLSY